MTKLFLLRHADAEPGDQDDLRPLSSKGIRQAGELGRFLKGRVACPEAIVHSGLKRAEQTAALVTEKAGWKTEPWVMSGLCPLDPVEGVVDQLPAGGSVLVVGHEPHLGRLASLLALGDADAGLFVMKKGTLLRLDHGIRIMDTGGAFRRWSVRWMVIPSLLKGV